MQVRLPKASTSFKAALIALAATLMLSACGGDAESAGEGATAGATPAEDASEAAEVATEATEDAAISADVTVVLGEWIVEPTPTAITAGSVTFAADNQGGEPHELVIARADDPADLPTDDDGGVDESQIAEADLIGEIEGFPNGEVRTGTFDLSAGTYVLFCNITETEDDTVESHFANGMATTFTVE